MTEEEYDISKPGSLFWLVVREPDMWRVADAKMKLSIARDWAEVGSPMPTAEDMRRLSPVERGKLNALVLSLGRHDIANRQMEIAGLQREAAELSSRASSSRKPAKEMDIVRDGSGKMINVKVYE
jgi:hypothetical protein